MSRMFLRGPRITPQTSVREMKDDRGSPHQGAKPKPKVYISEVGYRGEKTST